MKETIKTMAIVLVAIASIGLFIHVNEKYKRNFETNLYNTVVSEEFIPHK